MSGLEDLYREIILDHYRSPRNRGELAVPPAVRAEGFNPLCGDEIVLYVEVDDPSKGDAATVTDLRVGGQGCSISQASASMLTEEIIGKTLDEVKQIDKQYLLDLLGIPLGPVRLKCALLSLKVLKAGAYGVRGWPGEDEE